MAHKGKQTFFVHFGGPWDGTKWGQEDFFQLIQTLPTFWAERIWILRLCIFGILLTQNFWISRSPDLRIYRFPGPQIPRSPNSEISRCRRPAPSDELSDPNLTPLPTHPEIKYVARALAAIMISDPSFEVCQRSIKNTLQKGTT